MITFIKRLSKGGFEEWIGMKYHVAKEDMNSLCSECPKCTKANPLEEERKLGKLLSEFLKNPKKICRTTRMESES